jgi:sulfatase modifying factor 1
MTRIPAGIYLMGEGAPGSNEEEQPAHEAIVATFDLDTSEVTTAAYAACVAAGACSSSHVGRQFCNEGVQGRERHPINCIDLRQAAAYCAFANKRLPTEREWEYSARGGSENRRFSWGDAEPTEAIACYHHPFGSCEVGSFSPGAFGLRDMTGNVWEWTQSEYRKYPSSPAADPIRDGHHYVYRGGSWSRRFPKWLRNALRNRYHPEEWSASIGVRCARNVEPLVCPAETSAENAQCVRVRGTPLCDATHRYDEAKRTCVLDLDKVKALRGSATTTIDGASAGAPRADAEAGEAAQRPCCSQTRTPAFDADCAKNWPKTPASYRFDGGGSYPERAPFVKGAGCVPRDMSRSWTSACCSN